jgi:hypothetical protein
MSAGSSAPISNLIQALEALHITNADTINISFNITSGTIPVPEYPLPDSANSAASGHAAPAAESVPTAIPRLTPPGGLSRSPREELADRIGLWVAAKLSGNAVGASGRREWRLDTTLWIVFRAFDGTDLAPPAVYKQYYRARPLVEVGGNLGNSLILGFASEWEARRALHSAGFAWVGYA